MTVVRVFPQALYYDLNAFLLAHERSARDTLAYRNAAEVMEYLKQCHPSTYNNLHRFSSEVQLRV